jgi:hypothetical protein
MSVEEKCDGGARDDELELTECVSGECVQTRAGHWHDRAGGEC